MAVGQFPVVMKHWRRRWKLYLALVYHTDWKFHYLRTGITTNMKHKGNDGSEKLSLETKMLNWCTSHMEGSTSTPQAPPPRGENFARLRGSNCLLSGQKTGSNAPRISSEILLLKDNFRRQSNTLHNFEREMRGDNTLRLLLKPFFKELFTNKGEILSCKCVKACKNWKTHRSITPE